MPETSTDMEASNEEIRILHFEDSLEDLELVRLQVEDDLPQAQLRSVRDFDAFQAALKEVRYDLILSDYNIAGVIGKETLEWVRAHYPDVPFIYVTGALGDEMVVDVLRSGARDYVLKDNLDKLPLAILRALQEQKEHKEREKARKEIAELNRTLERRVEQRTRELQESLERERQLSQVKSRFIAVASHQFRTPLTVIKSNIDILALKAKNAGAPFQNQFEKSYERIDRQIARMTSLMDDVLILGKGQSGAIQVDLKSIDLVALVREIVDRLNTPLEPDAHVELKINGAPVNVCADIDLLDHAVSNVVANSIKYSKGADQTPSVMIDFTQETTRIIVQDYGIGIPEDELSQVFNPFYRASNVEAFQGTGLGMSIVKEYLDLFNAEIAIHSQLNAGTTVAITLKPITHEDCSC